MFLSAVWIITIEHAGTASNSQTGYRKVTGLISRSGSSGRGEVCTGIWMADKSCKLKRVWSPWRGPTTCFVLHPVEISRPLEAADCDWAADVTAVGATLLLSALEKTINPLQLIALKLSTVYCLMCAEIIDVCVYWRPELGIKHLFQDISKERLFFKQ